VSCCRFMPQNLLGGRPSRVGSGQEICVAGWHLGQENHNHQRKSRKWLFARARDRPIKHCNLHLKQCTDNGV
jgi:hypothetical protein